MLNLTKSETRQGVAVIEVPDALGLRAEKPAELEETSSADMREILSASARIKRNRGNGDPP